MDLSLAGASGLCPEGARPPHESHYSKIAGRSVSSGQLRRVGQDGHLADYHRLDRPVSLGVFRVAAHRQGQDLPGHVQAPRHLAEYGVLAIHARCRTEVNVELAGGRVRPLPMAGADRALFMNPLGMEFRLEPVADAPLADLAGAQRAAALDQLDPGIRLAFDLFVNGAF